MNQPARELRREHVAEAVRPAPLIVRVLPPDRTHAIRSDVMIILGCGSVPALFLVMAAIVEESFRLTGLVSAAALVAACALIAWLDARGTRRLARLRSEGIQRHGAPQHPAALAMEDVWPGGQAALSHAASLPVAEPEGLCTAAGGCVVYFGIGDVPAVGDYRFEPVILTPRRTLGSPAGWIALILVPLLLFVAAAYRTWLFGVVGPLACILLGAALLGIFWGAAWLWGRVVRQRYVRLAPGVVQFLRYYGWTNRPTVQSYPMAAGTLVVVTQRGQAFDVWFKRGDREDRLALSEMPRAAELAQVFWQAVLSTAPTPPLNEAELIG